EAKCQFEQTPSLNVFRSLPNLPPLLCRAIGEVRYFTRSGPVVQIHSPGLIAGVRRGRPRYNITLVAGELLRAMNALGGADIKNSGSIEACAAPRSNGPLPCLLGFRLTAARRGVYPMIPCAGAGFKSLSDTWVDRMIAHGRPIPTELGELAEFERKLIP